MIFIFYVFYSVELWENTILGTKEEQPAGDSFTIKTQYLCLL